MTVVNLVSPQRFDEEVDVRKKFAFLKTSLSPIKNGQDLAEHTLQLMRSQSAAANKQKFEHNSKKEALD